MSDPVSLETPIEASVLYLAETAEDLMTFRNRPAFTGDVYELPDGRTVALVQHPCAMRRGAKLAPKLLVCETKTLQNAPPDWSTGHFKRMFLPDLAAGGLTIEFDGLDVVSREDIQNAERRVILAETGVNLLVQRWIHHNSRVVIKTMTIHDQTTGPFEEADLVGESLDDLVDAGLNYEQALGNVDQWLGEPHVVGGVSRREMLDNPQTRGAVRSSLRRHVRETSAAATETAKR